MQAFHPLATPIALLTRALPCPCRRCYRRPGRVPTRPWWWNCRDLTRSHNPSKRDNSGCCFRPLHGRVLHSDPELRHHRRVGSVVGTRGNGGRGRLRRLHLGRPRRPAEIGLLRQELWSTVLPLASSRRLLAGNSSLCWQVTWSYPDLASPSSSVSLVVRWPSLLATQGLGMAWTC